MTDSNFENYIGNTCFDSNLLLMVISIKLNKIFYERANMSWWTLDVIFE